MAKEVDMNEALNMSDAQLEKTRQRLRDDMREKFDKWMTVYDEEATTEDINKAKEEFDKEVAVYANKNYTLAEENAVQFATLALNWNAKSGHWDKGAWKGVIMFNKVMLEHIEKYTKDNSLPFEVDYATLMYMYQTMGNPSGEGLESARLMAEFENFDLETGELKEDNNFITYSHLFERVLENVRELTNVDKKLKLMRERINIMTAGVKFDWKITEIEEFLELHDAWIGTAVPDGEHSQKCKNV